jgi:hypothetical protein
MSPTTPTGARQPLTEALGLLAALRTGSFAQTERIFLDAMWSFDGYVASGIANQGDIQNGKGDFFNDFLSGLLRVCSGKDTHTRPDIAGLSFANHKLDIAYPPSGTVELTVETKVTGVPKHPRNKEQKHPEGRPGSADLEKRIKEAAFKNIDIKGEIARHAAAGGGATSDLATWLRRTPPKCYLFFACRVVDDNDLKRTQSLAQTATVWFDGVGLCCYGKNRGGTAYEPKGVHPTLQLDRVLSQVCTVLRLLD